MEELFFTPESKLSTVFRTNCEIITALAAMELAEENIELVTGLIEKHSDFVLDLSIKVIQAERLDIKILK